MIIEFLKDTKDPRPGRTKVIKKGTRLQVTPEFAEELLKSRAAKDISSQQEEFLKEMYKKNIEE